MYQPRTLFRLFSVFYKQTLQFLQQINVKNVCQVCGGEIWTHDLKNTSLLPWPLDQGIYLSYRCSRRVKRELASASAQAHKGSLLLCSEISKYIAFVSWVIYIHSCDVINKNDTL